jgi:hypothetical protein
MAVCTRCDGTGFLNLHQVPDDVIEKAAADSAVGPWTCSTCGAKVYAGTISVATACVATDVTRTIQCSSGCGVMVPPNEPDPMEFELAILAWIAEANGHDVQVCDCCAGGNGWHGEPGFHDESHHGPSGPYAYNGGLPECW